MTNLDAYAVGFLAGAALMGLFAMILRHKGQNALLASAVFGAPERLADGRYYYLVPEDTYCEVNLAAARRSPPIPDDADRDSTRMPIVNLRT